MKIVFNLQIKYMNRFFPRWFLLSIVRHYCLELDIQYRVGVQTYWIIYDNLCIFCLSSKIFLFIFPIFILLNQQSQNFLRGKLKGLVGSGEQSYSPSVASTTLTSCCLALETMGVG